LLICFAIGLMLLLLLLLLVWSPLEVDGGCCYYYWFHPPLELLLQVLTPLELVQPLLFRLELVVKIFLKVAPLHHLLLFLVVRMVLQGEVGVVCLLDSLLLLLIDWLMMLLACLLYPGRILTYWLFEYLLFPVCNWCIVTCYLKAAAPLLTALERLVRQRSTCLLLIYIKMPLLSRKISISVHDALIFNIQNRFYSAC
jgi:hypothetical protein